MVAVRAVGPQGSPFRPPRTQAGIPAVIYLRGPVHEPEARRAMGLVRHSGALPNRGCDPDSLCGPAPMPAGAFGMVVANGNPGRADLEAALALGGKRHLRTLIYGKWPPDGLVPPTDACRAPRRPFAPMPRPGVMACVSSLGDDAAIHRRAALHQVNGLKDVRASTGLKTLPACSAAAIAGPTGRRIAVLATDGAIGSAPRARCWCRHLTTHGIRGRAGLHRPEPGMIPGRRVLRAAASMPSRPQFLLRRSGKPPWWLAYETEQPR